MKRFVITGTVFTILLATVSSIEHFLDDSHYNPGFYEFPWIISLHVAPGAAYLLLVVLQLTPRIRADRPDIHRNVGRLTVALGLTSATTAVLTTIFCCHPGHLAGLQVKSRTFPTFVVEAAGTRDGEARLEFRATGVGFAQRRE